MTMMFSGVDKRLQQILLHLLIFTLPIAAESKFDRRKISIRLMTFQSAQIVRRIIHAVQTDIALMTPTVIGRVNVNSGGTERCATNVSDKSFDEGSTKTKDSLFVVTSEKLREIK